MARILSGSSLENILFMDNSVKKFTFQPT